MTNFIWFTQQPLVHALGWTLLHFIWQGTIIAILLAGALAWLAGRSSQTRYLVCCGALGLVTILPLLTLEHLAAAAREGDVVTVSHLEGTAVPMVGTGWNGNAETWLEHAAKKLDRSVPWILSLWLAGVILLLGRLNLGLMAARRMKSMATQPAAREWQILLRDLCGRLGVMRAIPLMNSALVQVPTVIGWLRPAILIPLGCLTGLSADQVEAILAHEIAHIQRHDYLVNVFQSVVETLLFYHPAVWWISKQIRQEREHCCDDLAVQVSGNSLAYAKALSFLEERRATVPMVALGANGGVLTMRIKRLLGLKEAPVVSRLAAVTLLTVMLVAGGLGVATIARAANQPPEDTQATLNLAAKYQQWLGQDVVWIITQEERAAFLGLKSDAERDQFMEQFWMRRNPAPGSSENKVKEEHYRRIAFANAHFAAANTPGWKTDRGRMIIVYGKPDEINSYPNGSGSTQPIDSWRYHSIRENGVERKDVVMTFVDTCRCGDYRLQAADKK